MGPKVTRNGKWGAKSVSPNGPAMRPKYSARNLVPCVSWGTTGTLGDLANVAQSNWRFIMVSSSPNKHISPSYLLGPVGDLGTLAKEVWRVANLEVSSPNGPHLQLHLLAYLGLPRFKLSTKQAPWGSWRSWNPRQVGLATRQFGIQLAEWSTASIAPPCLVRPPTLQAINQAWCCPTGSSFKVHMFRCKAWNSILVIPSIGPKNLYPCEHSIKPLKFVNG
uniref:Uncharacterized protein n=1 Tax=Solanum tuberosum TaxID=4113 RepID=M1DWI4_SOLTU